MRKRERGGEGGGWRKRGREDGEREKMDGTGKERGWEGQIIRSTPSEYSGNFYWCLRVPELSNVRIKNKLVLDDTPVHFNLFE